MVRSAFPQSRSTGSKYSRLLAKLTLLVGTAFTIASCNRSQATALPTAPSILLIVLDTVRADYLSCYGYPRPTTPNLDRLAREGTRFSQAQATDCWTLPSHASLLTGLFPTEAGATSETNHLSEKVVTLAERLKSRGYETNAFVFNAWISRERGFGQGFDQYHELWREETFPEKSTHTSQVEMAATAQIAKAILNYTREKRPYFVFVNFNVAHMPYDPSPAFESRFQSTGWSNSQARSLREIKGLWAHLAGKLDLNETDFQIMRDLYAAEVAMADEYVGSIVDALRKDGTLDDTVVIVTSDHGENIGDHGLIDHLLSMYQTTLHVPLLIRFPKRLAAGKSDSSLVSLVDVVPTVLDCCDMLDADAPPGASRMSLCSGNRLQRAFVVSENDRPVNGIQLLKRRYPDFDTSKIDHRLRMIRTERYKLIWRDDERAEAYDLEQDPHELHDISTTRPEIRDQLLAQLKDWMTNIKSGTTSKTFTSKDDESLNKLRSLGYLD